MQFRLGNVFKDDVVIEAELVLTSKRSRISRRFSVSVYVDETILAPNGSGRLDSRALPRRANEEFGLNVTRALKAWSLLSENSYTLQVSYFWKNENIPTFQFAN